MLNSTGFRGLYDVGWQQFRAPLLKALLVIAYCSIVLACFVNYMRGETSLGLIYVFLAALSPVCLYVALRAPLAFPFCLYIVSLPFDSISSLGSGGTLSKLLGLLSAVAIVPAVLRTGIPRRLPKAVVAWVLLLAFMLFSLLWTMNSVDGTSSIQMYGSLIALYALLALAPVKKFEFNTILAAIVLEGVIAAGLNAYLFRQDAVATGVASSRYILIVGDSSIDPNLLAGALVLPFAISLYWLFNSRYWALRVAMLPALAVLLLGFAAAASREGFIELAAMFAYLIVRSRHRIWLAAILLFSSVTALLANPALIERFQQGQRDGGAGRTDIWHIGIYALRDHWLIGAGVGNFPDAFDREYLNVYAYHLLGWHWVAHNVPLTIATELGVAGSIIFCIAVFAQLTALRKCASDMPLSELRLALEGACIAALVAGFFASVLNTKFLWLAFSIMLIMRTYAFKLKVQGESRGSLSHFGRAWHRAPSELHETHA